MRVASPLATSVLRSSSRRLLSETTFLAAFTSSSPSFVEIKAEGEDSFVDELELKSIEMSNEHDRSLIRLLAKWRTENQQAKLSSLLIGKVWARIMYSLATISDKAKEKVKVKYFVNETSDILLGTVFSRFIWGIINSALIEEVRFGIESNEELIKQFQNAKNVATSDNELIKNLGIVIVHFELNVHHLKDIPTGQKFYVEVAREFKKTLPLTYTLITCPLIFPYLGKTNGTYGVFELLFQLLEVIYPESFLDTSIPKNLDFSSALKFVSRLPVMGCFNKEPVKSTTKSKSS